MSRRFWIGTPKGQNTTADTFFNTSRVTTEQVSTSSPTTYPSLFDTFYDTDVPTEYVVSTTYDVSTAYPSNFFYAVNTSHPTADTRVTEYYDPGTQTQYSRNTLTSYVTNYTYPVNTDVVVVDDVYAPATRNTTTVWQTEQPIYSTSFTPANTTSPGFTVSTTYGSPTSATYPDSASGCYYYDASGNLIGQDSIPSNCSIVSCSTAEDFFATGNAPTSFSTSRSTSGTTEFLTHIEVLVLTAVSFNIAGLTDPSNGVFDCYDSDDPDVEAYCDSPGAQCQGCTITVNTERVTDNGYDRVTSAPATITTTFATSRLTSVTYLERQCQTCQLSCTTNYVSNYAVPTYYPPSTVPTQYTNIEIVGYNTITDQRNTTTSYQSNVGTTSYISVRSTQVPTSRPTSHETVTQYYQPTGDFYYDVPTEYTRNTTYATDYPTSVPTTRTTQYPTDVATSVPTATPTGNETSVDTTVITSFLTDNDVTTTYQTSRSTTWFTQ